jgi:hypothetical protein
MPLVRVMHRAVASIVRSASATAFTAEVLAVAATAGGTDWAAWRRFGLGWRFWIGLGSWSALLAFACFISRLSLAATRRWCGEGRLTDTGSCAWLKTRVY